MQMAERGLPHFSLSYAFVLLYCTKLFNWVSLIVCSHRKDRGLLSQTHIANNAVSNSIPIKKKETKKTQRKASRVRGWPPRLMTIYRITSPGRFLEENKSSFYLRSLRRCEVKFTELSESRRLLTEVTGSDRCRRDPEQTSSCS